MEAFDSHANHLIKKCLETINFACMTFLNDFFLKDAYQLKLNYCAKFINLHLQNFKSVENYMIVSKCKLIATWLFLPFHTESFK